MSALFSFSDPSAPGYSLYTSPQKGVSKARDQARPGAKGRSTSAKSPNGQENHDERDHDDSSTGPEPWTPSALPADEAMEERGRYNLDRPDHHRVGGIPQRNEAGLTARGTTAVVLVLGIGVWVLYAWSIGTESRLATAFSYLALIAAVIGLITGSTVALAVLAAGTIALWLVGTAYTIIHPANPAPALVHQEPDSHDRWPKSA